MSLNLALGSFDQTVGQWNTAIYGLTSVYGSEWPILLELYTKSFTHHDHHLFAFTVGHINPLFKSSYNIILVKWKKIVMDLSDECLAQQI